MGGSPVGRGTGPGCDSSTRSCGSWMTAASWTTSFGSSTEAAFARAVRRQRAEKGGTERAARPRAGPLTWRLWKQDPHRLRSGGSAAGRRRQPRSASREQVVRADDGQREDSQRERTRDPTTQASGRGQGSVRQMSDRASRARAPARARARLLSCTVRVVKNPSRFADPGVANIDSRARAGARARAREAASDLSDAA